MKFGSFLKLPNLMASKTQNGGKNVGVYSVLRWNSSNEPQTWRAHLLDGFY
jgi:hypothetical protein